MFCQIGWDDDKDRAMAVLPQKVCKVLESIESDRSIGFSDVSTRIQFPIYRKNVGAVIVHPRDLPLSSAKAILKVQLSTINWQCSEMNDRPSLILLAPMEFVSVEVAFHATRSANVASILESGLLPNTLSRSTTERADCEGNIYVCPDLGILGGNSNEEPPKETAHWWRWHLSQTNRLNDVNWCILRVAMAGLSGRCYRDIWSKSGLILDCDSPVSPGRISVEWEL